MKRLLALLLSGIMVLSMSACGNTSSKTTSAESTKTEESIEETKTEETDTAKETEEADTSSGEPVEITFWHAMSGVNEEAIQKITDDFMAENPNIKVTLMNQGGYLDLFDKLMASAKADQLPNLAQIYSNRLSWYVDKGLALDLTSYIHDPEIGLTEEDKADFPAMFMDDCISGVMASTQCHSTRARWFSIIM